MPRILIVVMSFVVWGRGAWAQEHHHPSAEPAPAAWTWSADASLFVGGNIQQRKFTDFQAFESQNWAMFGVSRRVGPGVFGAMGMLSLEPFTLHEIGSP